MFKKIKQYIKSLTLYELVIGLGLTGRYFFSKKIKWIRKINYSLANVSSNPIETNPKGHAISTYDIRCVK